MTKSWTVRERERDRELKGSQHECKAIALILWRVQGSILVRTKPNFLAILILSWGQCAAAHRISMYHDSDVIMSTMASQIASLMIVYSTVYSGADQRKHQSSASMAFVRGIHRWPVNSLHKGPVTRKMFPFDDVIMFVRKVMRLVIYFMCCVSVRTYC